MLTHPRREDVSEDHRETTVAAHSTGLKVISKPLEVDPNKFNPRSDCAKLRINAKTSKVPSQTLHAGTC